MRVALQREGSALRWREAEGWKPDKGSCLEALEGIAKAPEEEIPELVRKTVERFGPLRVVALDRRFGPLRGLPNPEPIQEWWAECFRVARLARVARALVRGEAPDLGREDELLRQLMADGDTLERRGGRIRIYSSGDAEGVVWGLSSAGWDLQQWGRWLWSWIDRAWSAGNGPVLSVVPGTRGAVVEPRLSCRTPVARACLEVALTLPGMESLRWAGPLHGEATQCSSCHREYTPTRKPRRGENTYCPDCRMTGTAARLSVRKSRQRRAVTQESPRGTKKTPPGGGA